MTNRLGFTGMTAPWGRPSMTTRLTSIGQRPDPVSLAREETFG
jgi:hypothetical protein